MNIRNNINNVKIMRLIAFFCSLMIFINYAKLPQDTRYADIFQKASPSVVNVIASVTSKNLHIPMESFFDYFFNRDKMRKPVNISFGSGVIISKDGLIVTNNHVIDGAKSIIVSNNKGLEYNAYVVAVDKLHDLALLKIKDKNFKGKAKPMRFADLGAARVGDIVLTVGNPFAIGQTATIGILSALFREIQGEDAVYLQTDAAINPGNSGGALIDTDGKLLGINTKKILGSDGMGFAVPVDLVRNLMLSYQAGGKLAIAWPGFTGQSTMNALGSSKRLRTGRGVIVSKVYKNGPASIAGLRIGDIVLSIDGKQVQSMNSLRYHISTKEIGRHIKLHILRRSKKMSLNMKLTAPSDMPKPSKYIIRASNLLNGVQVANLSPRLSQDMGLHGIWSGVVIVSANNNRMLNNVIAIGCRIVSINNMRITNVSELKSAIKRNRSAPVWNVVLQGFERSFNIRINNQ